MRDACIRAGVEKEQDLRPKQDATNDPKFPKYFDGRRFYNPDSRQAPGLFMALRWKLTSRPEPSPRFIADVEESKSFLVLGNGQFADIP